MKVITSENLESTGYSRLFKCVKKEGIEPVFKLVEAARSLPSKEILLCQTTTGQKNALDMLVKKNEDVIKYFKKHKKELTTLSLTDENVYNTLASLLKNYNLIDLYLDNAKMLEKLQVQKIEFVSDLNCLPKKVYRYYCKITPLDGSISVSKYYTDGKVTPMISEEEAQRYNISGPYCQIPFSIAEESEPSFVLETEKNGSSNQHRRIEIMNFGFNGSKLPTSDELDSDDVPKALIKSNNRPVR